MPMLVSLRMYQIKNGFLPLWGPTVYECDVIKTPAGMNPVYVTPAADPFTLWEPSFVEADLSKCLPPESISVELKAYCIDDLDSGIIAGYCPEARIILVDERCAAW